MQNINNLVFNFIKDNYTKNDIKKFLPLDEDKLFDLENDIAQKFEYHLVNMEEDGKEIDKELLNLATKVSDILRECEIDIKELSGKLLDYYHL